ncbi:hypothetical protein PhaeoP97_02575 [Phaeobacter porticola]|uniref:Uncharacterized protein n=1 Tax=Phaeobacter porticola TaxID=1844006 RepID=A0A1L3I784_9RHOB|nr:hypothetical protein PhaeoP97_02575 [Phaeobacter porticola]
MAWLAMLTSAGVMMLAAVIGHVVYALPIWGLLLLYSSLGGALGLTLTVALMLKNGGFSRSDPTENSQD